MHVRCGCRREFARHRFHEQALASYDKAIAIQSDQAEAFNHRGNTLPVQPSTLSYRWLTIRRAI